MDIKVGVIGSLISLCVILLLETCKKDGTEAAVYEITGHVYSGCPKQPASNKEVRLYMTQGYSNGNSFIAGTTTDAYGYFKMRASYYDDLLICDNQFVAVVRAGNINDIEVHVSPSTFLRINLNVSNSYSVHDTLFISIFEVGLISKVPGPFNSGFLLNDSSYNIHRGFVVNNSQYILSDFWAFPVPKVLYRINDNAIDTSYVNLNLCDTSSATLYIK